MSCPCGLGESLEKCCGPFLSGDESPPTAEKLMRSRYTAYTQEQVEYIKTTHVPKQRDEVDLEAASTWAREAEWLGLDIVDTVDGGPEDESGEVEFIAKYSVKGNEFSHHERSLFKRIDGTWYYVDGDMIKPKPVTRDAPKVGRNEPCPCGSGKKFKKCCGAN